MVVGETGRGLAITILSLLKGDETTHHVQQNLLNSTSGKTSLFWLLSFPIKGNGSTLLSLTSTFSLNIFTFLYGSGVSF